MATERLDVPVAADSCEGTEADQTLRPISHGQGAGSNDWDRTEPSQLWDLALMPAEICYHLGNPYNSSSNAVVPERVACTPPIKKLEAEKLKPEVAIIE